MTAETTAHLQEEARIRAAIDSRANAIRNKNVQEVLPNFTEDSVGFFFEPPLQQSPLKEDLAGWFATWSSQIGYEIGDLKITAGNDVAFCHALSQLTGTRTDGTNTDLWFRETLCFQKIDGQWRIAHIHESVPIYMDGSLKAAVDLNP
jgi:ketosteroid isomerase-like protein